MQITNVVPVIHCIVRNFYSFGNLFLLRFIKGATNKNVFGEQDISFTPNKNPCILFLSCSLKSQIYNKKVYN